MTALLCVYCGSSPGARPVYADAARRLADAMLERGLGLVYGGGRVGLMGILADAVLAGGGHVVGVIPRNLRAREVGHDGVSELVLVDSMHERKARMAELATAGFVAMPGGFGTFEEILEALTWAQLGIHRRPCALLDVDGYWRDLLAHFDRAEAEGFLRPVYRRMVLVEREPAALLAAMAAYEPPDLPRWLSDDEL